MSGDLVGMDSVSVGGACTIKLLRKSAFAYAVMIVFGAALITVGCAPRGAIPDDIGVIPVITAEIGGAIPEASAFVSDTDYEVDYFTDISLLVLDRLGDVPLSISVNDELYEVTLRVVDTVPPTALPQDQIIGTGETLAADAFVSDISDATAVSVSFTIPPDFTKLGPQDVTVVLEDQGGNTTELTSRLYIFGIKPAIEAEAGTDAIAVRDYLIETAGIDDLFDNGISLSFQTGISRMQLYTPGEYEVVINANNRLYTSIVTVADTTPPTAAPANRTIWLGKTIDAMSFLTEVQDISDVSARFKTQPDFRTTGTQEITVILEDSWGNASEYTTSLTIMRDTVPPVISGAASQTIFVGNSISYRSGVSAYDNADGPVSFSVDSSAVNIYETGDYAVVYSAVDSSGNRTSVSVTVSVIELNYELVYSMADNILANIITPDMSLLEKAHRIYNWVRGNFTYTGRSDKSSTIIGAYSGLRTRQGDCFTYYSVSEVLLTRAGVPNMRVTRVGGVTQHFWNLINVGTGWYHFDSVPTRYGLNTFMFTSAQAEEYTRVLAYVPNYYVYDKSLYPAVVGDVIETPDETEAPDEPVIPEEPGEPDESGESGEPDESGENVGEPGESDESAEDTGVEENENT